MSTELMTKVGVAAGISLAIGIVAFALAYDEPSREDRKEARLKQEQKQESDVFKRGTHEITLDDGTNCAVTWNGGIDCDWRR